MLPPLLNFQEILKFLTMRFVKHYNWFDKIRNKIIYSKKVLLASYLPPISRIIIGKKIIIIKKFKTVYTYVCIMYKKKRKKLLLSNKLQF